MASQEVPLVSVIICYLNEEKFLTEAVESVLQQEYVRWELLLVDDGSTDNSVAIAKAFAGQYAGKIHYLEHQNHANKGLSASRNLGITKSRGELLAFLDADDVWFPYKLTQQVAIMQQQPKADVLLEATEYWYSWSNPKKQDIFKQVGAAPNRLYEPPQLMYQLYPLGEGEAPSMSGMLLKTKLAQRQSFEDSFTGMYEDQAFLSKLYLHARIYIMPTHAHRYRQRVGSIMHTSEQSGNYHQVRHYFLNWLETYFHAEQVTDKRLRRLLWKAQLPYRSPLSHKLIGKLSIYFPNYINKLVYKL